MGITAQVNILIEVNLERSPRRWSKEKPDEEVVRIKDSAGVLQK